MAFTEQQGDENGVSRRPSGWYVSAGKRVLDLIGVIPILIVAAPVLAIASIALRIRLGPKILLRQTRVGRNAEDFEMLKFRTMKPSRRRQPAANDFEGDSRRRSHKWDDDPRHTRLGRLLRRFSIDELPQLFNVLKGDMSLVGPRPELASQATVAFRAHIRHAVRPGLTGPYQISPLRSQGDLEAGLDIDRTYVESLSFRSDLAVLISTVFALMRGTGR